MRLAFLKMHSMAVMGLLTEITAQSYRDGGWKRLVDKLLNADRKSIWIEVQFAVESWSHFVAFLFKADKAQ